MDLDPIYQEAHLNMSTVAQLRVVQTRLEPLLTPQPGGHATNCRGEGLQSKPSENLLFPAEAQLPAADLAVAQSGRGASSLACAPPAARGSSPLPG